MTTGSKSTCSLSFSIAGIPDSSGLRIRATHPVGLYVSSKNREAAQYWFVRVGIEFLLEKHAVVPGPGEGVGPTKEVDWDTCIRAGEGVMEVQTLSFEKTLELLKGAVPDYLPPVETLTVDRFTSPHRAPVVMIRDPGDMVDIWLVRAVEEDVKNNQL